MEKSSPMVRRNKSIVELAHQRGSCWCDRFYFARRICGLTIYDFIDVAQSSREQR
jgi:hypothetical protein